MNEQLIAVIREAGAIMKRARDIERGVSEKEGDANFVTAYDSAVQKYLFDRLALLYPDAAFIGEEDSADDFDRLGAGRAFVIDPIDGTTNFIKHFGHSCVSVALCEHGTPVLGAVYNPYTDEMYCAEAGKGAWLVRGGARQPLHVSGQPLSAGLTLVGTSPYYAELHDATFAAMRTLFEHSLDLRRSGSAALDLCLIAAGCAEVFYELRLSPWDFAAGALIIREAGGVVTQMNGAPLTLGGKCSVLAGNPASHGEALRLLAAQGINL